MLKDFTPRGGKLQPRASNDPPITPRADTKIEPEAPNDFGEAPTLDATPLLTKKPPKRKWWQLTKKQKIILGVVLGVLILAGAGWFNWQIRHSVKGSVTVTHHKKAPPKPTTVASNLTGLQVDPSVNQRPVTAVMIENSPDARPQSGLDQAGVVFEAVAEGGITRFLALFQDTQPDYIGPIRSVRPYYVDWLHGFDASVAHVGGSPEALAKIKSDGVKDLDQFANGGSYTRISSRYAPHNVYTSIGNLNAIETKKGYGASKFTSFERKADAPSKQPTAQHIDFAISSALYNAHFDYDPTTNAYLRSQAGAVHLQINQPGAQGQIRPKVVLALVMPKGIEADDLHTSYGTIGSGALFAFEDGIVQQGTWSKTSGSAQFTFTGADGKPIKLNAGQTWITIVDNAGAVTSKP